MKKNEIENQRKETPPKNTFKRIERLKSGKIIEELFNGKSNSKVIFPYRMVWSLTDLPVKNSPMQSGFVVPARIAPKAVMRNRLKRQMRESFRIRKHSLYDKLQENDLQLAIMFVYISRKKTDFNFMARKMQHCLDFLEKQILQND